MSAAIPRQAPSRQLAKIVDALASSPTAAYTAPHIYPQAVPMFKESPGLVREQIQRDDMRLYVHIPFCNYHCSYCCYAKRVGIGRETMERYVEALEKELEYVPEGTGLSQLFVGGGTPTALPADLMDRLLGAINQRMPSTGEGVHTVEASPDSISDEHLDVLKSRGVGRISMGVQSLQEELLDNVTRKHGQQTALDACRKIIDTGFILNIDLIYGLPGQSEEDFHNDFSIAADSGVHSVTAQNLRVNHRTAVQRQLKEDEVFNLQRLVRWREAVRETALAFGYSQTRWHTYKKMDSIAARHKRLPTADTGFYGHQLGIGMSARSSLGHKVYRNIDKMTAYMERIERGESPVQDHVAYDTSDLKTLLIINSLGDGQYLDYALYGETFNSDFRQDYADVLERLDSAGLLQSVPGGVELSNFGKNIYDLVTLAFYPDHAKACLQESMPDYQMDTAVQARNL